ncbi:MAG: protein kinase [Planctomycetes bacterium]|nr:protein kinase [Planctomycetota bacterium]
MNWLREADAEPLPGYRLIKPLGTGGFGEVWLCEAPGAIHKAIKFVYGNLHAEDGGNIRAEQEYRALQKVKEVRHPFVLSIERIDICDGELVIVMELAEKSLHDCLVEEQEAGHLGIPHDVLISYLSDAADGLDYLIERFGLLHLDVKPRNLFLVGNHVKVADFGLVKNLERQSSSGLMGGMSPMYAAPETFSGQMSKHSDQYSLAIVYMELLTGQRPFNARTIRQLALQHMSEEPDLRALPEADRPIIARALSKDPAKRFPNCVSFIRALGGVINRPDTFSDIGMQTPYPPRPLAPEEKTPPTAPRYKSESPKAPQKPSSPVIDTDRDSLHVTQAQVEVGTLRPAIFIGVGGFGMLALKELRRRMLDRVGDLTQTPSFRFLYIDPDPEAPAEAVEVADDKALRDDQVFLMRLQPVTNYRRRILDHLNEWLPREKLYSIPRSLQTIGSRALGRLAFCDNYLRFDTRFSREVQVATHPESLAQTMTQSGMTLRDNCPRIYILAAAGGGASGMLTDIGFTLRRRLAKMQFGKAPLTAFLFCGAPHDPSTPKTELANIAATLTELNHFHDPAISFSAQYGGPDGPKLVAQERPFTSIYLMERENRGPDSPEQCAAHLASYLVQDLTSPLGSELDMLRDSPAPFGRTPFRSFGAAGIWFPRGLLLRSASRLMCQRLLYEWQEPGPLHAYKPVDDLCAKMQVTPALQPDAMMARMQKTASASGPSFAEAIATLMGEFENDLPNGLEDSADWSKKAFERMVGFVGSGGDESLTGSYIQSRVTRSLNQAVIDVANEFTARLHEYAIRLMEMPGKRIAATEAAMYRMSQFCSQIADSVARRIPDLAQKSGQAWAELKASYEVCQHGTGYRLFGNRVPRNLRTFLTELSDYASAKLKELLVGATARLYRTIHTGLEEKIRDLTFHRQRLSFLERILEPESSKSHSGSHPGLLPPAPSQASMISSTTQGADQVLLPFGEKDIEWAAARFVMNVSADQWTRLEEVLQTLVLAPLGGLHSICQKAGDLLGQLAGPLIDQTVAYLNKILNVADIAEGEFLAGGKRANIVALIQKCWEKAQPLVPGELKEQSGYLIISATEAGMALAKDVNLSMPTLKVVHAVGQTSDISICREQSYLAAKYLEEMLSHCKPAYLDLASRPATSPHSRFDILEWVPLDS